MSLATTSGVYIDSQRRQAPLATRKSHAARGPRVPVCRKGKKEKRKYGNKAFKSARGLVSLATTSGVYIDSQRRQAPLATRKSHAARGPRVPVCRKGKKEKRKYGNKAFKSARGLVSLATTSGVYIDSQRRQAPLATRKSHAARGPRVPVCRKGKKEKRKYGNKAFKSARGLVSLATTSGVYIDSQRRQAPLATRKSHAARGPRVPVCRKGKKEKRKYGNKAFKSARGLVSLATTSGVYIDSQRRQAPLATRKSHAARGPRVPVCRKGKKEKRKYGNKAFKSARGLVSLATTSGVYIDSQRRQAPLATRKSHAARGPRVPGCRKGKKEKRKYGNKAFKSARGLVSLATTITREVL